MTGFQKDDNRNKISFAHFDGLSVAMEKSEIEEEQELEATKDRKGRSQGRIHKAAVASLLCCIVGAILSACFVFLFSFTQNGFDAQVHREIATSGTAIAAQRNLLIVKITQLSQTEAFDSDAVLRAIGDDELKDYATSCSNWLWNGLLKYSHADMPTWDSVNLEQALKADATFLAAHPNDPNASALLAQKLGTMIGKVVFPFQPMVINLALDFLERGYYLSTLRTVELVLGGVAMLFLLSPLLILRKNQGLAIWYTGIGLVYSGVLVWLLRWMLERARIATLIESVNEAMGFQAERIFAKTYQAMEISAGVMCAVGAICAAFYLIWRQHVMGYSEYELQSDN